MKNVLLILILMLVHGGLYAQFGSLGERIKQKAKEAVERQTDKTIDKVVGKGEDKVDRVVDETLEGKKTKKKDKTKEKESDQGDQIEKPQSKKSNVFSVSSKFDFVPGDKVIFHEDFQQDALGDFPVNWNTNASGELVQLSFDQQQKWLQLEQPGLVIPDKIGSLPENFTLEFDMAISADLSEMQSGLKLVFPEFKKRNLQFDQFFPSVPHVIFDLHPFTTDEGYCQVWVSESEQNTVENKTKITWEMDKANHIAIWRQNSRLRLYINQQKVWDLPKAFVKGQVYSLLFATNLWEGKVYLSNLKLAQGLPDTRNKLLVEGKFSTSGILFDVNSDQIQAASAGILKELATLINENPGIKVKIVGHTDAQGNNDFNLKLSKQRAESVKQMLSTVYGVDASRLITDGKGASQPIDNNQSPQGRANNRRVEFIKI